MKNRGFTLIELLITIAVIGILSTIAITSYVGVIKKAARSEAYTNLQNISLLEQQLFADSACYNSVAGCPAGGPYTFVPASPGAFNPVVAPPFLPRFQPGNNLSFTYVVTLGVSLTGAGGNTSANPPVTAASATPCFVATATGLANTRVFGDVFAIDCNNNRNF